MFQPFFAVLQYVVDHVQFDYNVSVSVDLFHLVVECFDGVFDLFPPTEHLFHEVLDLFFLAVDLYFLDVGLFLAIADLLFLAAVVFVVILDHSEAVFDLFVVTVAPKKDLPLWAIITQNGKCHLNVIM